MNTTCVGSAGVGIQKFVSTGYVKNHSTSFVVNIINFFPGIIVFQKIFPAAHMNRKKLSVE